MWGFSTIKTEILKSCNSGAICFHSLPCGDLLSHDTLRSHHGYTTLMDRGSWIWDQKNW